MPGEFPGIPASASPRVPSPSPSKDDVDQLCHNRGAGLMQHLMSKAIQPKSADKLIREWTYKDILHITNAAACKAWEDTCCNKLAKLQERKVYELVDHSTNCKIIKNQWVFDVKPNGHKCTQLVIKEFSQVEGIDYNKLFSPVVCYEIVQMMLALAALEGWHMEALDIKSVYLYGKLDKEIYMKQPRGFKVPDKEFKVLQLLCALNSLKQARFSWWNALNKFMLELGFEHLKSKPRIFLYKKKGTTMVVAIIYVDDAIFCGPNKALVDEVKTLFMCKWECRDLGPATKFLHMRIRQSGSKILIDQCAYLDRLLD